MVPPVEWDGTPREDLKIFFSFRFFVIVILFEFCENMPESGSLWQNNFFIQANNREQNCLLPFFFINWHFKYLQLNCEGIGNFVASCQKRK